MLQFLYKKQAIHFLHIGKTGGTAVKDALQNASPNKRYVLYLHPHNVKLRDIPQGEKVFFFLRDPITRFVSGFYSRQRQGLPRYYNIWNDIEEQAFTRFLTPNELANSLSSKNPEIQNAAVSAMKGINHLNSSYMDWFESESYFSQRIKDIFFIGFQESLNADFEVLKKKLHLPANICLPTDPISMHKNLPGSDTHIDELAAANLKKWYEKDYSFLMFCKEKMPLLNL